MNFLYHIKKIQRLCRSYINKYNLYNMDVDELVNILYLELHTEEITDKLLKYKLNQIISAYRSNPLIIGISENSIYFSHEDTQKICKGCNDSLPLDCFYSWSKKYVGRKKYRTYCKECEIKRYRNYREQNKEKIKEAQKKYRGRYKKSKKVVEPQVKRIRIKVKKIILNRLR